ncbi:hypothetical protein QAD02_005525 [Eretmocerus hayati]|uniref:Uncharacterized protein n=1 Tax=Eretmocerus hayati TaxID=131215 RepID=A0ACC2NTQ0_9HYME|nr:hypothetical protein QAD02_005525 [Eretmocerus hayati]
MSGDSSSFTLPNDQPIVRLECETAFNTLTLKKKLYAHYLSQAAWNGGLIIFLQTSPESPLVFALLHKLYLAEALADLRKSAHAEVSVGELKSPTNIVIINRINFKRLANNIKLLSLDHSVSGNI